MDNFHFYRIFGGRLAFLSQKDLPLHSSHDDGIVATETPVQTIQTTLR